ncbi:MAG: hypothetical protein J5806_11365 [Lentisphaeria bacterium]|nr:hypothetical protein [Lentisphaeria bacterium]
MIILGWLLVIISGGVIFLHTVVYPAINEQTIKEHPVKTVFSGGSNLIKHYSFTPPLESFEIFIYALGIILLFIAYSTRKEKSNAG